MDMAGTLSAWRPREHSGRRLWLVSQGVRKRESRDVLSPPKREHWTLSWGPSSWLKENKSFCARSTLLKRCSDDTKLLVRFFDVYITMLPRATCSVSRESAWIDHVWQFLTRFVVNDVVSLGNRASFPWQHGNLNVKPFWPNFSRALLNWKSQ